jgi:hypothetical protein
MLFLYLNDRKKLIKVGACVAVEQVGEALFPEKNTGGRSFYARLTPDASA